MKNYKIVYLVKPFVDTFESTIEAPNEQEALKLWGKSILSYNAKILCVKEVLE